MTRRIAFLIFPDFQLLDVAGPIAAFEVAERLQPGSYELRFIAERKGMVTSSSGAAWQAGAFARPASIDTLVISGGNGTREALRSARTLRFLGECARHARRVTSVCSGSYLLAAAGLLDGKQATTHWSRSADFAQRFPRVRLAADRIFIKAGKIWSSAGITAGIDLALALIEEDLGEAVARRTAQQLVVYYRRPGGQSQFSALLELERADGRFAKLLDAVRGNLRGRHSVSDLATAACMSPRNFARVFQAETGESPARAVMKLRADTARAALESGRASVQEVARNCGFGDPERMRRAFLKLFGIPPAALKRARSPSRS
jgi:transcriptional regulator GlxA family with amidase domain